MTHTIKKNPLLELAHDYVLHTGESVFLTGKAGTGKTTFLRKLKEECPKQMVVLAPTGVAAINAGGVTIHSFFQLPFAPFVPVRGKLSEGDEAVGEHALVSRLRYNREKRDLIQSLDLLVIDEVSMVRADVLDAIDTILRSVRKNEAPFGGLQMLFIGDLYQLPPVVQGEEWKILGEYYKGPFFFHSHVIRRQPPVYVELQTIYRQSDEQFIQLLNEVRNNELTDASLQLLNSRHRPAFLVPDNESWITLATHNKIADSINENALQQLPGPVFQFDATIEGEFSEKSFPAEVKLMLKEGAQVMFLKNDVVGKKYFNGKIGRIVNLSQNKIEVLCEGDERPIDVKPEIWTNVQYSLNRALQVVEEKQLGSFVQYPLRLAWAVTIHKSQGLTFDRAVIDAASSFSAGQVYVALSRCRSLEGLVLRSPVPASAVRVDTEVRQYSQSAKAADELKDFFQTAQRNYQLQLLQQVFDATPLVRACKSMCTVWQQFETELGTAAIEWTSKQLSVANQLQETAEKFLLQLNRHLNDHSVLPEADPFVNQRTQNASAWFVDQLKKLLDALKQLPVVSDSQETAEELEASLVLVIKTGRRWLQLLEACQNGYNVLALIKAKSKINISDIIGITYSGSSRSATNNLQSPHPVLEGQLRQWRNEIVQAENKPVYTVCTNKTLTEVATFLPQTREELIQISGFGARKVEQYGEAVLQLVKTFCEEHHLQSHIADKMPKRQRKPKDESKVNSEKTDTRLQSYTLWQQGLSVLEIAGQRKLQPSTIESHLATYVVKGEIPITALVPPALLEKCEAVITELEAQTVGPVKEVLGDELSYNQIRMVLDRMHQKIR